MTQVASAEFKEKVPTPSLPPPATPPATVEPEKKETTTKPEPKPPEEPPPVPERPNFLPPKPPPQSPLISPSSIPNPSPSISTTKPSETGFGNYGSYFYSMPGYSAFQPVQPIGPQNTLLNFSSNKSDTNTTKVENESEQRENLSINKNIEHKVVDLIANAKEDIAAKPKPTPKVESLAESKLSVAALVQPCEPKTENDKTICQEKRKNTERFSLITSIPISKIDMKNVNTAPDGLFQNKKPVVPFNPAFLTRESPTKIEITSNILLRTGLNDCDPKTKESINQSSLNIDKSSSSVKDEKVIGNPELKDEPNTTSVTLSKPIIPTSTDARLSKGNSDSFIEPKNKILLIQNKNQNPKMLLTISQQQSNPQILLQRNFDPKNLQVPSRLSILNKKDENTNKVVALKRLHQDNCDENDFENLITENQIYGNKIVVKEKLQGTTQEQNMKRKLLKTDKSNQDTKSVVLQPNVLYLSNVQFPANLMMIKNNKLNQAAADQLKNKNSNDKPNNYENETAKVLPQKEFPGIKPASNILQTISNRTNNKQEIIIQSNQKVFMTPQMLYHLPMIVDANISEDKEANMIGQQTIIGNDYAKLLSSKNIKDTQASQDVGKDKLFIACPYQMDPKSKPKILIANLRSKVQKVDEVSTLDIYETRRRSKRLKHLQKEPNFKGDAKKSAEKVEISRNTINSENMHVEICKEFMKTKLNTNNNNSDTDSDYIDDDFMAYEQTMNETESNTEERKKQINFLSNFNLGTQNAFQEKMMIRQERSIARDAVAAAYISAGRIDILSGEPRHFEADTKVTSEKTQIHNITAEDVNDFTAEKRGFMAELRLSEVSKRYKEDYEKTWQRIIHERNKRNGVKDNTLAQIGNEENDMDTKGHLMILKAIKNFVNENNNLIKKRLDNIRDEETSCAESIHALAEKNISELTKISKMADRCVKHFKSQDKKRDLNPGFDSENIQKCLNQASNYPKLKIPDISKIIALTSIGDPSIVSSRIASIDEPQSSENRYIDETDFDDFREHCEKNNDTWSGMEIFIKSYRKFDTERRKEISQLQRRITQLQVESANAKRRAARESEVARALLAEQRFLLEDEMAARVTLQRIVNAIDVLKES